MGGVSVFLNARLLSSEVIAAKPSRADKEPIGEPPKKQRRDPEPEPEAKPGCSGLTARAGKSSHNKQVKREGAIFFLGDIIFLSWRKKQQLGFLLNRLLMPRKPCSSKTQENSSI